MTNQSETMAAQTHASSTAATGTAITTTTSSGASSSFKYRVFDALVILFFVACMAYLRYTSPSPFQSPNSMSGSNHVNNANNARSLKHLASIAEEEEFLHSFVSTGDDADDTDGEASEQESDDSQESSPINDMHDTNHDAQFQLGEIVFVLIQSNPDSKYYVPAHVKRIIVDPSGRARYDLTSAMYGFRTMNDVHASLIVSKEVAPGVAQVAQVAPRGTEAVEAVEAMCQFKKAVPCTIIEYHGSECISAGGCYEVLSRWEDETEKAGAKTSSKNSNLRGVVEIERRIPLDHVQFRVEDLNINSNLNSNDLLELENKATVEVARRDEAEEVEEEP